MCLQRGARCSGIPVLTSPPASSHPPPPHTTPPTLPPRALIPCPPLQAAFGRNTLAVSSLLSYVGLGLGLLGSSLALPFGLYVLICQRTAGKQGGGCVCVCTAACAACAPSYVLSAWACTCAWVGPDAQQPCCLPCCSANLPPCAAPRFRPAPSHCLYYRAVHPGRGERHQRAAAGHRGGHHRVCGADADPDGARPR